MKQMYKINGNMRIWILLIWKSCHSSLAAPVASDATPASSSTCTVPVVAAPASAFMLLPFSVFFATQRAKTQLRVKFFVCTNLLSTVDSDSDSGPDIDLTPPNQAFNNPHSTGPLSAPLWSGPLRRANTRAT